VCSITTTRGASLCVWYEAVYVCVKVCCPVGFQQQSRVCLRRYRHRGLEHGTVRSVLIWWLPVSIIHAHCGVSTSIRELVGPKPSFYTQSIRSRTANNNMSHNAYSSSIRDTDMITWFLKMMAKVLHVAHSAAEAKTEEQTSFTTSTQILLDILSLISLCVSTPSMVDHGQPEADIEKGHSGDEESSHHHHLDKGHRSDEESSHHHHLEKGHRSDEESSHHHHTRELAERKAELHAQERRDKERARDAKVTADGVEPKRSSSSESEDVHREKHKVNKVVAVGLSGHVSTVTAHCL
jgi:hypothetical protein